MSFRDVEHAIEVRDPELADLIARYIEQGDPEPGVDELEAGDREYEDDDSDKPVVDVPAGAFTIDKLRSSVSGGSLANKTATERKLARREAFAAAEGSAFSPPRLRLGKLLVALYEAGDPEARAALIDVFASARLKWGVWQAAKTVYKLAEARHDAAMFGVLAFRFDAMTSLPYDSSEIGMGTVVYLRRRAWRYLRLLGRASPEVYPTFAVEVLRHYPDGHGQYASSWVAAHIWGHAQLRWARGASFAPPTRGGDPLAQRAYPEAWKLSPAPLLRLLEVADNDSVCDWAIRSLRADHALALRGVEPAWLARLGQRPVAAIHGFVVTLLRESPEFHQSKLRDLGLHDVVIGFLRSPSSDARTYALEYAGAHAPDLGVDVLVDLVVSGAAEVATFAAARLESLTPQQLGLATLLRLVDHKAAPWAVTKLGTLSPSGVDAALFVDTAARGTTAYNALVKFYNDARVAIPAGHFTALLDDPRFAGNQWSLRSVVSGALTELGKRKAREIGIAWIQKAFEDRARTDAVSKWLDAGMLQGADLDLDWLKSLVGKPRLRQVALRLLGDRRRVAPAKVGLSWLLETARSPEGDLAQFAQRMLLESFEPGDFADGDSAAGVARLWELATVKKPEMIRTFAATYLKAHHPDLGKRLPEARALGITPRLGPEAYTQAIVQPLLDDDRADVRRFAVAIAAEELVRWNDAGLVYELAGSNRPEPRALGGELLLGALVEGGDARRVPAAWIDGPRLFRLAESSHKAAREVALTLIRRMYDSVGGAERLAWLMDSTERDVRLFAVRLFWERHRPKPWPSEFQPRKQVGAAIGTERFADLAALRQFARVVLFGLPPGRVGEREVFKSVAGSEGAPRPERALPASVAKRRLIEAMRDVALEDLELARAIAPVLGEFTESTAKGEWQASVQALTALRARHGELAEHAAGGVR